MWEDNQLGGLISLKRSEETGWSWHKSAEGVNISKRPIYTQYWVVNGLRRIEEYYYSLHSLLLF